MALVTAFPTPSPHAPAVAPASTTPDERHFRQGAGLLEDETTYGLPRMLPPYKNPFTYTILGQSFDLAYAHVAVDTTKPVLLLLHGHSSSIEEFGDLFDHVRKQFDVYAVDMPNCGRSSTVPVSTVDAWAQQNGYPPFRAGLLFLRDVLAAFADDVVFAHTGKKIHVAGGSLGGNMALWLGCLQTSWLDRVTVWSPGSAWKRSVLHDLATQTAGAFAARQTWNQMEFLTATYGPSAHVGGLKPQPWFWYYDCWGESIAADPTANVAPGQLPAKCTLLGEGRCQKCRNSVTTVAQLPDADAYPLMAARKVRYIGASFESRLAEPFDNERARWHWKIAYETMANSWSEPAGAPLVTQLTVPATFAAGTKDDDANGGLFMPTRELFAATQLAGKPCKGRWVHDSGHSLHNERPLTLTAILGGQ